MSSYTISPIWGAGAQLFDNSGNVLSGGKIYTYAAGTTTPAATYTTPIGNTANSNPIVANAAGRLTNEIWLPVAGAYKFVLKDANDVLLATYDNIPTIAQPPISNDASSISYESGYTVTAGNFTVGATYLITSVGTTDFVAIGAAANTTGIHFTATGVGSGTGQAQYTRTVQTKLRESVSVTDFGAVGDGVTDDYPAIMAAINSATYGTGYYVSGPAVYFPPGNYYCSQTINLKKSVRLYGDGSGLPFASTASIQWPAGVTGIIVNRYNTYENTVQSPPTTAGDASIIEGLILKGTRGTADAAGGHGIWLRARALVTNCAINNFEGNGINIVAASAGGATTQGNANNYYINNGRITGCLNGIYVSGGDANAGQCISMDCSSNRLWGITDQSFLGNSWTSCHTAANGVDVATGQSAYASYDGLFYHAVPGVSQATLLSTQPGTDYLVWRQCSTTAYAIAWTGSNPTGTYRQGGGYNSTNLNARCTFTGCYAEGGQGLTWLSQHSIAVGGFLIECPVASGAFIQSRFGATQAASFASIQTSPRNNRQISVSMGSDPYNGDALFFRGVDANGENDTGEWRFLKSGDGWAFNQSNAGNRVPLVLTGGSSTYPYITVAPAGIGLGAGLLTRKHTASSAIPTSGNWFRGDVVYNSSPTAGGYIGWSCVTSGTNGTLNSGATTATTTAGSPDIVVNSNTGLTLNSHITIAGVAGTFVVDEINGTTITLHTPPGTSVTGASVAFSAATFKTFGTITP